MCKYHISLAWVTGYGIYFSGSSIVLRIVLSTCRYRNDFGDTRACIDFCLQFMNDSDRSFLIDLLEHSSNTLAVKYSHNCGKFYPNLKENIDTTNL